MMSSNEVAPEQDESTVRLADRRAEKDARDALFQDLEEAVEPEWEEVVVPRWGGRTFYLRGATIPERTTLLNRGWRQVTGRNGEQSLQQTADYVPLLIATCLYWDNPATGKRERVFQPKVPKDLELIGRNSGPVIDPLVKIANRLSGLSKELEEEAESDFLDPETSAYDTE